MGSARATDLRSSLVAGIVLAALASLGTAPLAAAKDEGIPFSRASVFGENVEVRAGTASNWGRLEDGTLLRTGDAVRTGTDAVLRVDFPWTTIILGPESSLEIPASRVLSVRLLAGRIEQRSEGADILKIQTPEVLVRGRGHVVVRQTPDRTTVVDRLGRFSVRASGRSVNLEPTRATVVAKGKAPTAPTPLPTTPQVAGAGNDPLYVGLDSPVTLEWSGEDARSHLVELVEVGPETPVIQRDVGVSPVTIQIPWAGTYRWRVLARTTDGVESLPSREGVLCVTSF